MYALDPLDIIPNIELIELWPIEIANKGHAACIVSPDLPGHGYSTTLQWGQTTHLDFETKHLPKQTNGAFKKKLKTSKGFVF